MADSDFLGPTLPADKAELFFTMVGHTLLQIQIFEMGLAQLALTVNTDPDRMPEPDLAAELKRITDRFFKAYKKDAAGALKAQLRGKIETELYEEIVGLVRERNFVVHRALREGLVADAHGFVIKRRTADRICLVGLDSMRLGDRLRAEEARIRSTWKKPRPNPALEEFARHSARFMIKGEVPLEWERRRREGREAKDSGSKVATQGPTPAAKAADA